MQGLMLVASAGTDRRRITGMNHVSSLPKPILPPQGTHVARAGFGRGRMGLLVWQPQKTKQNLGTDKTHHPPYPDT